MFHVTGVNGTKNRVKLTATNTVTLRNGKRGLQPWLLTTDATNTVDSINGLSTLDNEVGYVTDSISLPETALTMIMKRIQSRGGIDLTAETTPTDDKDESKLNAAAAARTEAYFAGEDFGTEETGISAANEAVNTVKTSTKVVVAGSELLDENIVIPCQKESNNSERIKGNTFECPPSPAPQGNIITAVYTDAETDISNLPSGQPNPEKFTDFRVTTRATIADIPDSVTAATTERVDELEIDSTTSPSGMTEVKMSDQLVAGSQFRVRTTVQLVENKTATDTEDDTLPVGVKLVEKGSNLTAILSIGVLSDSTTIKFVENYEEPLITPSKANASTSSSSVQVESSTPAKVMIGSEPNFDKLVLSQKVQNSSNLTQSVDGQAQKVTNVTNSTKTVSESRISGVTTANAYKYNQTSVANESKLVPSQTNESSNDTEIKNLPLPIDGGKPTISTIDGNSFPLSGTDLQFQNESRNNTRPPDDIESNEINFVGVTTESGAAFTNVTDISSETDFTVELENIRVASNVNSSESESSESIEESNESDEDRSTETVLNLSSSNATAKLKEIVRVPPTVVPLLSSDTEVPFVTNPVTISETIGSWAISDGPVEHVTISSFSTGTQGSLERNGNQNVSEMTTASVSTISENSSLFEGIRGDDQNTATSSSNIFTESATSVVEDIVGLSRFSYENNSAAYPSFKSSNGNSGRSNLLAPGSTTISENDAEIISRLTTHTNSNSLTTNGYVGGIRNETNQTESASLISLLNSTNSVMQSDSGNESDIRNVTVTSVPVTNCTGVLQSTTLAPTTNTENSSRINDLVSTDNTTHSAAVAKIESVTDANQSSNASNTDTGSTTNLPDLRTSETVTKANLTNSTGDLFNGDHQATHVHSPEFVTKINKLRTEDASQITDEGQAGATITTESSGIRDTVEELASSAITNGNSIHFS